MLDANTCINFSPFKLFYRTKIVFNGLKQLKTLIKEPKKTRIIIFMYPLSTKKGSLIYFINERSYSSIYVFIKISNQNAA